MNYTLLLHGWANYDGVKQRAWWDGQKDKDSLGFTLEECVENGKPTWVDLSRGGQSGLRMIRENRELIERLSNRIGDHYPIVSPLALAWFEQPGSTATPADDRWAAENVFTLAELRRLFQEHPAAASALPAAAPVALREFVRQVRGGSEPSEPIETEVTPWMQERTQRLQQADRGYWREVIGELAPTSRDRPTDPRSHRSVTRIRCCRRAGKSRCFAAKDESHR